MRNDAMKGTGGRWQHKMTLGVVSLTLALIFVEVVLRSASMGPLAVNPDQRRFWKYDAVLGWDSYPGREGRFQTEFFDVYVSINSKGLRSAETTEQKPPGIRRVLVVGDSFAWGFGVEQTETFSARAEAAMPGTEVINGGVSGYSTDQVLLWLRRKGLRYHPDVVVYQLSGNDDAMNYMRRVYWIYYKPNFYLTRKGGLVLEGVPVPRASPVERLRHFLRAHSALAHTIESTLVTREALFMALARGLPDPKDPHRLTLSLVNVMRTTAQNAGAEFVVVTNSRYWFSPYGSYQRLVSELRRAGHDVIDVESLPGWDPVSMQIPGDGHWNARGHAFVAEALVAWLRQR